MLRIFLAAAFALFCSVLLTCCGGGNFFNQSKTVPQGEMTLKAFKVQWPSKGAIVRVKVNIGQYWNYKYRGHEASHYSLNLEEGGSTERAWVPKESSEGKAIYEVCKDGKQHTMTLKIYPDGPDGTPTLQGQDGIAVLQVLSTE